MATTSAGAGSTKPMQARFSRTISRSDLSRYRAGRRLAGAHRVRERTACTTSVWDRVSVQISMSGRARPRGGSCIDNPTGRDGHGHHNPHGVEASPDRRFECYDGISGTLQSGCPNDWGHQPSDGGRATDHATMHCTEYLGYDENRRASDTRSGLPLAHEGACGCSLK